MNPTYTQQLIARIMRCFDNNGLQGNDYISKTRVLPSDLITPKLQNRKGWNIRLKSSDSEFMRQ